MFICTSICVCAGGAEYRSPTSPPVLPQSYACVLRTALPIPVTPDQDPDGVDTLTRYRYRYPYSTYLIGTVTVYLSTLINQSREFCGSEKVRLSSRIQAAGYLYRTRYLWFWFKPHRVQNKTINGLTSSKYKLEKSEYIDWYL